MLELLPKKQITLETAIQRRSEHPSAAAHTENAATKTLYGALRCPSEILTIPAVDAQ
jgi:hypothetical protein